MKTALSELWLVPREKTPATLRKGRNMYTLKYSKGGFIHTIEGVEGITLALIALGTVRCEEGALRDEIDRLRAEVERLTEQLGETHLRLEAEEYNHRLDIEWFHAIIDEGGMG